MKDSQTFKKWDPLRSMIYGHWQQFHPKMLEQFQREHRLEAELEATAQQFDDLMYTLVVVQKMDYSAAWEIAVNQFLLPEEESSSTSQNQEESLPATSE